MAKTQEKNSDFKINVNSLGKDKTVPATLKIGYCGEYCNILYFEEILIVE